MLSTRDRLLGYVKKRVLTESGWLYFCEDCSDYHPKDFFYKNANRPFGIFPTCNKLKNSDSGPRDYSMDYLRLNNVSQEDVEAAIDLLEKIGYDTSGDVHKQFITKHFPNGIQNKK